MLYTVQDTTMTALGDAVRNKVVGDIELYYNSGWITRIHSDSEDMKSFFHTMDGVSKIKLTINIEGVYNNKFPTIYYGKVKPLSTLNMTELVKNETTFPYEIILDGDKVSLYIQTNPFTNPAIFYYEIVGLDKNGNEFKYTPAEMVDVINELYIPNINPIVLTDSQYMACGGILAGAYIDSFGNTITTENITNCQNMFYQNTTKKIPFDINCKQTSNIDMNGMYMGCDNLETAPNIYNAKPSKISYLFSNCPRLRIVPNDLCNTWDWSYIDGLTGQWGGGDTDNIFNGCYSLRSFPMELLAHGNSQIYNSYTTPYNLFNNCYVLDEVVGWQFPHCNGNYTSNIFYNTFYCCYRLKNIIFALQEDGSPYTANWSNQNIDLSRYVGYTQSTQKITDYNSGITIDKRVTDDTTYATLKDDPDWFSTDINYSRYNHDSAVNTINSLPDTSAYLASNGGTNTIKFQGQSGALTDGGAINTLTEEEIAVATSRGWTVSLA